MMINNATSINKQQRHACHDLRMHAVGAWWVERDFVFIFVAS